jgi:NAD-dependent DNA ligase
MMIDAKNHETEVLAHRYLYYVLGEPVLPDLVYDVLEREARGICPRESPVHRVGSSLPSDYPEHVIKRAKQLQGVE